MAPHSLSGQSPSPSPPPPLNAEPLPYEILFSEPTESLLGPLPSPEDIEGSSRIIKGDSGRRVYGVGPYVVKFGPWVEPIEGENMRFVREHTDINVPRVYAVYQRVLPKGTKFTYIVMEEVPGDTLQNMWEKLDDGGKLKICRQLRENIDTLRRLPPPAYFGCVGEFHVTDSIFDSTNSDSAPQGPFSTELEFLDAMVDCYSLHGGERMKYRAEYFRRVFPKALRGNDKPVFTHNDLQRKNIMITPEGKVFIIDWATSGWYPSYWEYSTTMFACGEWRDDWPARVPELMIEFPSQYIWLSTVRNEIWF